MNDIFDELEEFAWTLGGNPKAKEILLERYPNAKIKIYAAEDLILPDNVVACDGQGEGEGEVSPVKRLALTFMVSNVEDTLILEANFEEIWTSPYAKAYDNQTWDFFFWDTEKDCEIEFKIPMVE